ncbi:poly(U)-specific endoribonuclease [Bufo bufo]|uniref:poly(U)-specific endoribonuclease n=1 Tax=Bufo bufo TaxID=8384 RepID=UPI001ABDDBEC|nr:poly(U)-specific endoribonuclease [Bufo bufo]
MKTLLAVLLLSGFAVNWAFETCSSDKCKNSCENRCGDKPDKSFSCQCNAHCERFGDCCKDYSICSYIDSELNDVPHHGSSDIDDKSHKASHEAHYTDKSDIDDKSHEDPYTDNSGTDISKSDIKAASEILYQSDVNKAADKDIILNKQEMSENTKKKDDLADHPLYKYVNEEIFKRPTYKAFIKLLDNYDRKTGKDETFTEEELEEQEIFLKEIMKTKVMKELYKFFHKKGLYRNEKQFVDDLRKMWFGLYSRSSGEQDSSGFEHVFVGEVKKNKVSGFHSWIQFYRLEKKKKIDYYSHNYDGPWTTYPDVLGKQFEWDGFYKQVGTQIIGSSPEFDFALYSLCFITRPGRKCTVSMGGHEIDIQTYEWTKTFYDEGKKFIATAYATF